MKMEQCVPKRRHIEFWRRGITQKKDHKVPIRHADSSHPLANLLFHITLQGSVRHYITLTVDTASLKSLEDKYCLVQWQQLLNYELTLKKLNCEQSTATMISAFPLQERSLEVGKKCCRLLRSGLWHSPWASMWLQCFGGGSVFIFVA